MSDLICNCVVRICINIYKNMDDLDLDLGLGLGLELKINISCIDKNFFTDYSNIYRNKSHIIHIYL